MGLASVREGKKTVNDHQRPKELHPAPRRNQPRAISPQIATTTRLDRGDQRPLQGRGHLAAALMTERVSGGNGDPAPGELVQQPSPVRPYQTCPPAEAEADYHAANETLNMVA